MEKKSFLIYLEYEEQLADLSNEELGVLLRAIFQYEKDGTEPKFSGLLKMAFAFIKGNLNRDKNKYDKRCVTSAINGSKGGRPRKKEPNEKPNEKPKKPKKADIDIDIDTDTDIDTDIDTEVEVDIFDFFASNFGYLLPPMQIEKLDEWRKTFTDDILKFAIEKCCNNNVRTFAYFEAILTAWKNKGFRTLTECKNENNRKIEEKPEWFDKEILKQNATEEERNEIEELLKEFEN